MPHPCNKYSMARLPIWLTAFLTNLLKLIAVYEVILREIIMVHSWLKVLIVLHHNTLNWVLCMHFES